MTEQQKQPNWFVRHKILTAILVIIVLAGIGGATSSDEPTNKTTKTTDVKVQAWDVQAAYDQIQTGMTKAQVEQITGKSSDNCTASESQFGAAEVCNYGKALTDKGMITVSYSDGKVATKIKSTY